MKSIQRILVLSSAVILVSASSIVSAGSGSGPAASRAKISERQARDIAQQHFHDVAFESAELENEHGQQIWSIDLRPHGSNDILEVQIDALSGEIIATDTETPAQQAAERAEDLAAKRH